MNAFNEFLLREVSVFADHSTGLWNKRWLVYCGY